jgi:hypothetical protein
MRFNGKFRVKHATLGWKEEETNLQNLAKSLTHVATPTTTSGKKDGDISGISYT